MNIPLHLGFDFCGFSIVAQICNYSKANPENSRFTIKKMLIQKLKV